MAATAVHPTQSLLRGQEAFAVRLIAPEAPSWRRFVSPLGLVRSLWQHRRLIRQFAIRELRGRYLGSRLGLAWSLLTPLVMLGVYTFVFHFVLKVRWDATAGVMAGSPFAFALTLFCGLLTFQLFAESVQKAPGLVLRNPGLVKRVVFPLQVLPVSSLAATLAHGLAGLLLVAVLSGSLGVNAFWFPLALLPCLLLILGLSWFFASVGVLVRDLGPAVMIGCQLLLFATPVFYPANAVPDAWRPIVMCNPLAGVVENVRRVLLWNQPPDWHAWLAGLLPSLVVFQAGYIWFMKTKRAFADAV